MVLVDKSESVYTSLIVV